MIFKGGLKPHEVLCWYDLVNEYFKGTVRLSEFCRNKNISHAMFSEMNYRFNLDGNIPEPEFNRLKELVTQLEGSSLPLKVFAKKNDVAHARLDRMKRHLYYKKIIANRDNLSELQIEPKPVEENEPMRFIKISSNVPTPAAAEPIQAPVEAPVAEVIPSKNDIEIVIAQGVKVIISPSVDSMKIIKIIDLLKDL